MTTLNILLPAILTLLGNLVFYLWIKARVDNSIEKQKISFGEIFKEKLTIYKEILKQVFEIKLSIQQYQYSGIQEKGVEIMLNINKFINYYLINQPFLSDKMLIELNKIREEFQSVFDNFFMHHSVSLESGIDPQIRTDLLKKFFEAGNKLKTNHPFKVLEETIINEMRNDLRIENLKA